MTVRVREEGVPGLRILFVCQNDLSAPTEKQALGFAQQLLLRGHAVVMSLGGVASGVEAEQVDRIAGLELREHRFEGRHLRSADLLAARRFRPDLIHAFNSRVPVIAASREFAAHTGAPVFVHFEDDEWRLPSYAAVGRRRHHFTQPVRRFGSALRPDLWWHSTRASLSWTRRHARALDALTPVLAAEVQRRLGRACATVPPVTVEVSEPAAQCGLTPDQLPERPFVLVTGTVWPPHLPDFELGLRALAEVQRRGHEIDFVHAGRIHPRFDIGAYAKGAGLTAGSWRLLGYLPFPEIPGLLRQAKILVQPGAPSEFNRLRLPSKLQSYLSSGTPTVTFSVGFGELLEDRSEVLKTYGPDHRELADRMCELIADADLRAALAIGGPSAARRLFDAESNTETLLAHYRRGLACP